jgi:Phosphoinositide 3-kinase family, accessory domain (PIK domain)
MVILLYFIYFDIIISFALHRSIQKILKYPPTRTLSGEDRQLLWKFRFSLMSEKKALTKFLRCVEWSDVQVSAWFFYFFTVICKLKVEVISPENTSDVVAQDNR